MNRIVRSNGRWRLVEEDGSPTIPGDFATLEEAREGFKDYLGKEKVRVVKNDPKRVGRLPRSVGKR